MSFYDDAKFMFLAGGAAGKDGKAYNIKPTNGDSYLSVNTDLSSSGSITASSYSLGWYHGSTQEGDSSIADNQITLLNASGEVLAEARASNGTNGNVAEVGVRYRLEYTVVENNSCTDFSTYNASDSPTFTQAPSTVGTHVVFIKNDNNQLVILRNSTENSSIVLKDIKVERDIDFTFDRGTDLTATRVGKDGYIEKGRKQLLVNTVWAGAGEDTQPTSWSKSLTADGTFDTTSTDGQIRFQAPTSSDRAFLTTPDISETGVLAQSVFVDAVDVVCQVDTLMRNNTGASATRIGIFEDGVEVTTTENVKAGKRYTVVWNKTANTRFRFGIGCDGGRAGDITLSRPQLEYGLAATAYIENTSTSATATAGLLEDEPRFDYTGGGCPALLIEGNAINLIEHTEYFESWTEGKATVTSNETKSPEGLINASKLLADANGGVSANHQIDSNSFTIASGAVSASVYAKKGNTDYVRLRLNSTTAQTRAWFDLENGEVGKVDETDSDAFGTITDMGDGWYRCTVTEPNNTAATTSGSLQIFINEADEQTSWVADGDEYIYLYGAQYEQGSYATSYIPNYGAAATASRTYDDPNDLVHGITMGTSCSFFLEATNFKVTESGGAQTSFLQVMDATSPSTADRLLFLGVANTASTFTLQAQNKESGTSATDTLSKTGLTMGSPFKALARYDGTSFDLFVNGVLEGSATIVADDHFGRVGLKNLTSQTQNGHSISQVILFDSVLSINDSEIITGTSYTNFAAMASELSYTEYE